jgi:probable F420-dependent oxidoreductase
LKVGLAPPNFAAWLDGPKLRQVTLLAEALGYDSLWFGDHIAFIKEDAIKYGNAFLDAFTCLSFVAGMTSRIKLGTDIVVVPYRHPVTAAKIAATLDVLSGGRFEMGVGAGHVELESEAINVPYADRGPMTDEYLKVMVEMWTKEMFSFHGRWVNFDDLCPMTLPIQRPIPLLVGGSNRVSMRRALDFDAAWTPMEGSVANVTAQMAELREMAEARGKPMPKVIVRWQIHPVADGEKRPESKVSEILRFRMTTAEMHEWFDAIADLGVDEIILDFPAYEPLYIERVKWFHKEFVVPHRAKAAA